MSAPLPPSAPSRISSPCADVRLHDRPRPRVGGRSQREQDGQALGRSRGGFSTKIHRKTDHAGLPLAFDLTPGQASDSRHFPVLLDLDLDLDLDRGACRRRRQGLRQPRQPGRSPNARTQSEGHLHGLLVGSCGASCRARKPACVLYLGPGHHPVACASGPASPPPKYSRGAPHRRRGRSIGRAEGSCL